MRSIFAVLLILSAAVATGCDDATDFTIDPLLATDTVEIAAAGAAGGLPSALDVIATGGQIAGGRFPELARDAEQWDVALRARNGSLVFLPASALGLQSRASITRAIQGETFASLVEAPGSGAFVPDSVAADQPVVVQQGAVYVIRSRNLASQFGSCVQYAKVQPLAVDVAAGRVRLQLTTNERCSDPRLAEEG